MLNASAFASFVGRPRGNKSVSRRNNRRLARAPQLGSEQLERRAVFSVDDGFLCDAAPPSAPPAEPPPVVAVAPTSSAGAGSSQFDWRKDVQVVGEASVEYGPQGPKAKFAVKVTAPVGLFVDAYGHIYDWVYDGAYDRANDAIDAWHNAPSYGDYYDWAHDRASEAIDYVFPHDPTPLKDMPPPVTPPQPWDKGF